MSKQVILTGLRANNDLHIGNYLGALLPIVDMAKQHAGEYQINLFVPDLHSFTTPIDHSKLQEGILNALRVFVAAGLPLDNPNIHIYRQSHIPAHSELTWILDCFTGFGEMSRMTQFKDKSGSTKKENKLADAARESVGAIENKAKYTIDFFRSNEYREKSAEQREHILGEAYSDMFEKYRACLRYANALEEHVGSLEGQREQGITTTVGLFNYPVLMASDILLYGATYVPVGDDQTQHLEFTRDIAGRMNNKFAELFVTPKPVKEQHEFFGKDQGLRIRDLVDPTKKMSKSDETGKGVIFLTDSPDIVRKKVMSATTDSLGEVQYDYRGRPGVSNLLDMLKLFGGSPDEFIGQNQYGPLKTAVADKVAAFLEDFQKKLVEVDEQALVQKLEASEVEMNKTANATLLKVQKAVGLRPV